MLERLNLDDNTDTDSDYTDTEPVEEHVSNESTLVDNDEIKGKNAKSYFNI